MKIQIIQPGLFVFAASAFAADSRKTVDRQ